MYSKSLVRMETDGIYISIFVETATEGICRGETVMDLRPSWKLRPMLQRTLIAGGIDTIMYINQSRSATEYSLLLLQTRPQAPTVRYAMLQIGKLS